MDFNGILLEFISLNGFSMDFQWSFNGFQWISMEFHWNLLVWMDFEWVEPSGCHGSDLPYALRTCSALALLKARGLCSSSLHWFSFSVRSLRCSLLFVLLFFSSLHSGSTVSHSDKWVGWFPMDIQWMFNGPSGHWMAFGSRCRFAQPPHPPLCATENNRRCPYLSGFWKGQLYSTTANLPKTGP